MQKTTSDGLSLMLPILAAVGTKRFGLTEVISGMPFWMQAASIFENSEKGTRARLCIQTNTRTAISGNCGRAAKSDAPTGTMKPGLARSTRRGSMIEHGFYAIARGYHLGDACTPPTALTTPTR